MNNFEIVSVAGKGVKLEFDTAEDADKFVDRMKWLGQKGYPMWVDDETKQLVYNKNKDIRSKLSLIPTNTQGCRADDRVEVMRNVLEIIDHIDWLERFFYPVIALDEEE